jgi:hypothetical protein
MHIINDDQSNNERTLPEEIVNSVLNVYNQCIHIPKTNLKNETRVIEQINAFQ